MRHSCSATRSAAFAALTPTSVVAGLVVLMALVAIVPVATEVRLPGIRALAPLSVSGQRESIARAPAPTQRFGAGRADDAPPTTSVGVRAAAAWRTLDLPPPACA